MGQAKLGTNPNFLLNRIFHALPSCLAYKQVYPWTPCRNGQNTPCCSCPQRWQRNTLKFDWDKLFLRDFSLMDHHFLRLRRSPTKTVPLPLSYGETIVIKPHLFLYKAPTYSDKTFTKKAFLGLSKLYIFHALVEKVRPYLF